MSLLCYLYVIIIFTFKSQYLISINKFKRHLVISMHCQLYIKALLIYSLKMASCKPKHVAAIFF